MVNKKIKSPNVHPLSQTTDYTEIFLKKYSLGIFILSSLFISFLIFKNFFFGDFLYFFKDIGSDSINITLPNFIEGQKLSQTDGYIKSWSFFTGMGNTTGNSMSLDPYIFITKILRDIFGINLLFYRIFFIYFIYILPSGIVAFYLFRTLGAKTISAIIGGLLFEFSGYMIIGSQWGHAYKIFFFIFYIFAFEQILVKKSWFLFPLAVFFQAGNLFLLATNSLFLVLYSLVRYLDVKEGGLKGYLVMMLKMAGLGLLGLALNAPRAWTNFSKMYFSPRIAGDVSQTQTLINSPEQIDGSLRNITTILRFYSNDLLGSGSNFKGWNNYLEAPIFYIGLLPLLLFSSFFSFVNKQKKIIYGIFLLFWLVVAFTPILRHSINFFIGNYFKNTIDIFVPFSILFIGILSFDNYLKYKNINPITTVVTAGVLLLLLHYPYFEFNNQTINFNMKLIISVFIIVYSLSFYLISRDKNVNTLKYLILFFVIIEIAYISNPSVNNRDAYLKNEIVGDIAGYNDITMNALDFIKTTDSSLFYRIEKDYSSGNSIHGSLNDAKAQGYFGTASYGSFNQLYYIKFLQEIDLIDKGSEAQTRWSKGVRGVPLMMTFASVKYFITKDFDNPLKQSGYDSIASFDDIMVLENKHYLPLGFTYNQYILHEDFLKLSSFKKQQALLRAIVLYNVSDAQNMNVLDTSQLVEMKNFNIGIYAQMVESLKQSTFKITTFKHKKLTGNINMKTSGMLFFSIPYDKGWTITVNGEKRQPINSNIGFMSIYLNKGEYNITLKRQPVHFNLTLSIAIVALFMLSFIFYRLFKKRNNKKTQ